ncbi:VanZ family protein [Halobacteriales archaeon Cl-PHB]
MPSRDFARLGRWHPSLVAAIALLVGSATPIPPRYNPDTGLLGVDKFLHGLGHLALAGALLAATDGDRPRRRTAVLTVAVSTVYGVATELFQERIPGREFEPGDVLAGFVGSVAGVLAWQRAVR